MVHPSQHPDVIARRLAESAACPNVHAILKAEERWKREDAALEEQAKRSARTETSRVTQLERRVRQLEALLGVGCADGGPLVKAIGHSIGRAKDELRRELDELKHRPVLHDAGVWRDDHGYDAGSLVTYNGGGWIAQRGTAPGERPGASPGFRLAIKSDLAEVRKVVKAELANR
jgi:hypothetical protein